VAIGCATMRRRADDAFERRSYGRRPVATAARALRVIAGVEADALAAFAIGANRPPFGP
jgi:hypothetical protein